MADSQDTAQSMQIAAQAAAAIRAHIADANVEGQRFAQNMSADMAKIAEESRMMFDSSVLGRFKNGIRTIIGNFKILSKQIKNTNKVTLALTGAMAGFLGGVGMAKTVLVGFGGIIKTVFNVGRAAVGAFSRTIGVFLSFFTNALNSQGGGTGLFEAIQDVKREFGALQDVSAQAVFGVVRTLRGLPRSLEGVGILLADALKNATEFATNLGPLFLKFAENEFNQATFLFIKGLGMTDEQLRQLVADTRATGESFNDMGLRMARTSAAIGAAVGVAAKTIAKEMIVAKTNIKAFGNLTDEEIGLAVGRFQSLGLEVEDVLGMFDKFATFESAADTVSQLTAAFGVQLDVFSLVKSDNPADTLDEIRRAFQRSGQSVENFDRRQLSLLGSRLDMDDSMIRLALSSENAGMSMEEIAAGAEASGEATKSLEEVLQDLTNQIARTRLQGQQFNGFLEAMNAGITRGIRRFLRHTGVLRRYRRSLRETYRGFSRLTRAVLDAMPGMDLFIGAIREIFDPDRFRTFIDGFKKSLVELVTNGGSDFESFAERMKGLFIDVFSDGGEVFTNFVKGGKRLLITLGNVLRSGFVFLSEQVFGDPSSGLAARLLQGLVTALQWLGEHLTRGKVSDALRQGSDFAAEVGGGIFLPIVDFFRSPQARAMFDDLLEAFKRVLSNAFETLDSYFRDLTGMIMDKFAFGLFTNAEGEGPGIVWTLIGIIFGPAVFGAVALGIVAPLGAKIVSSLLESVTTRLASRAASEAIASGVSSAVSGSVPMLEGLTGSGGQALARGGAAAATSRTAANAAAEAATIGAQTAAAAEVAAAGAIPKTSFTRGAIIIGALALFMALVGFGFIAALNALPVSDPEALRSKVITLGILIAELTIAAVALAAMGLALSGPQFAGVAVGLAAIGVVALGMYGLIALIKSINNMPTIKDGTIAILDILPRLIWAMVGVTAAIAGVGALMVGIPFGLGAVGLVGGIAAVSFVMDTIKDDVISIIDTIKTSFANMSDAEIAKTEKGVGFVVNFLEAISPFMDSFASVVNSTRPGLFRGARARARAIESAMNGMNEYISKLFVGSDSAVNTLMSSVIESTRDLTPDQISAVGAITPLFEFIGAMIEQSINAAEVVGEGARGFGRLPSTRVRVTDQMIEAIKDTAESAVKIMEEGVPELIRKALDAVRGNGLTESEINSLGAIGSILSAFSAIMSSIPNIPTSTRRVTSDDMGTMVERFEENPDFIDQLGRLFKTIGPSIGVLIASLNTSLAGVTDAEAFASKAEGLNSIFSALGTVIDLSGIIYERFGQTGEVFTLEQVERVKAGIRAAGMITEPIGLVIQQIDEFLPEHTVVSSAVTKLDAIEESNILTKLTGFFENSAGVFSAIRDSNIVALAQSIPVADIARILPAAAAAVQAFDANGASIANDSLRIALNGTTFDITVILQVDGKELGKVAASHIYNRD